MGDFLGFTFGNVHSSDLGITRVSGGDRYDEQLHPEIKDRTAEVPGLNGEYYFGSDFGLKSFDIEIAFDHLTEKQFRDLRKAFGTKEIKKLIFDERPYKYYMAKLESPVELSYICFDERDYAWEKEEIGYNSETQQPEYLKGIGGRDYEYKSYSNKKRRIYKGEGKLTFKCYFPFAKSRYKQLLDYYYKLTTDTEVDSSKTYYIRQLTPLSFIEVDEPQNNNISNYYERLIDEKVEEWAISSGILSAEDYESFDKYDSSTGIINIYNAGDFETGFRLYCPFSAATDIELEYAPYAGADVHPILLIKSLVPKLNTTGHDDIGILINTDNCLIQGVQTFGYDQDGNAIYTTSGNIYNQYIDSGYFFKFEPNNFSTDGAWLKLSTISNETVIPINSNDIDIFYDYLYF